MLYLMDNFFFFLHSAKNNLKTYVNIRKSSTGQGDDYTAECLQDYPYFKEHCKNIIRW